jgi:hypothetical protein
VCSNDTPSEFLICHSSLKIKDLRWISDLGTAIASFYRDGPAPFEE